MIELSIKAKVCDGVPRVAVSQRWLLYERNMLGTDIPLNKVLTEQRRGVKRLSSVGVYSPLWAFH